MKSNRQFVIPFKGLKLGKHDFVFDIDDKFFDAFEESEISKASVHVSIRVDKKVNMLELHFDLKGNVMVMCDRCLDDFELPIAYNTTLYVKFGDITEEQTEEILVLSHHEFELNVSQYIYEYTHLSLPFRRVHPTNEKGQSLCNKEMLKKLEEYLLEEKSKNTNSNLDDLTNILNTN